MESLAKSRMDDLLSAEVGKHDYDWLLTPPGTPVSSYSDKQTSKVTPRSRSNARSVSTGKASKLSVSQSEKDNSAKPARSSSAMRPSMPNAHSSFTHFSNSRQTALLNTSTASVTSKPSTPGHRSNTKMTPFTPSRSSPSRSSQNSRPSSPTVRPQIGSIAPSTSSTAAAATRTNSRPSTPTRRASAAAAAAAAVASANIRSTSPAPRGRAQTQTKPPERAISTGRQRRPGTASTQSSSPLVSRGRLQENTSNARSNHKVITASETAARRATKPALKNTTDIKQSTGGIRGTSPFPQSTRSAAQKGRPGRSSELGGSTCRSAAHHVDAAVSDDDSRNGDISNGYNGSVLGNQDIAVPLKSA